MNTASMLPATFLGTGLSVPTRIVTNEDLTATLDTSDEWIRSRTGIRERRYADAAQSTSDLCVEAATDALRNSGVAAEDVDVIILSTVTPDQPLPSTALMVKEAIGAHRAIPIDLTQAACSGGVLAMFLGIHLLQNPAMNNILVIGGEALSRLTDPADRKIRVFFGDAAGAVVLGRSAAPEHGLLGWDIQSALSYEVQVRAGGSRYPATPETVAAGDHFLYMNGRTVWEEATEHLPKCIHQAVTKSGLDVNDIRHYVIHQANGNVVNEVMDRLGVERTRAEITVDWLGNTGSATVFTVLHTLVTGKKIQRGDTVVIAGIGAGFIWGALCLRFG
ncbi:3-oxoacyl-ACP synthase III family protein [Nocardia acidivorans]|uniref:3-oxoacyl-ACP synthase III family protein n=1 Tax=Nocardia acidivorans TaxID=404580 RepID=UPI000B23E7FA|nr:ketoacyl-ACP synthase III [Nocardia acidivorans]